MRAVKRTVIPHGSGATYRSVAPSSRLTVTEKTISLRLPESMLEELKLLANKNDVHYLSLVAVFLSERNEEDR